MQESAVVEAVALGGVSVVCKHRVVRLKFLECLLGGHFKNDDHEGPHQESPVDHPVAGVSRGAVVENSILLVVLVSQKSGELSGVSMNHCQIQGAEVLVEWEVGQIVVNIEEESVLVVLRRLRVTNPVQFI